MRIAAVVAGLWSLVTVPQHDAQRSNLDPRSASVSGDGRYVAFVSSEHLAPADTNHSRDVYVLDRVSGSVALESVAPEDEAVVAGDDSDDPGLSRDGRFLVYQTHWEIVWRDRTEGTTVVVGHGRQPSISGDGRFVAFTSDADVALFDVLTRTLRRIGAGHSPSVSGDGRYVAFVSSASLDAFIVAPKPGEKDRRRRPVSQVYVRDVLEGTTRAVSVGSGRKAGDGDSWGPAISADGQALAFASLATNLVSGDRNRCADIFLADLAAGSIGLVSRNAKGVPSNGASVGPAVSSDGHIVAFQSEASDLTKPGDDINLLWDVFLFDGQTRQMTRLSSDPASQWMEASGGPAIDSAGDVVAFSSRHPIDAADKVNDFDLFVWANIAP